MFVSCCSVLWVAHNVLQIGDVAGLVALTFILQPMFIGSRMFLLPLHPPYPPMCCYGLVIYF